MRVAGAIVLAVWAVLSLQQIETWRSDRALWAHAVRVNPLLARPALNLASTFKTQDEAEEAVTWLVTAAQWMERSPRPEETAVLIRQQLFWIAAFGSDACGRPTVRPYC